MKINRIKLLKKIRGQLKPFKFSIITLFVTAALAIPISLISPKMFQILIDEVLYARQSDKFLYVALGLLFVYGCRFILDSLNLYFGNKLLNGFTYNLRVLLWKRITGTYFSNIEKRSTGDLKMRMVDDVDSIGSFVKEQIVDYIFNIVLVCVCFYLIASINITMTLYCIWVVPAMFLINYLIANGAKKINEQVRTLNQEYYTSTHNSLQLWREIKIQNAEAIFINKFRLFREKLAVLGFKSIRYWFYTEVFSDFKSNYLSKVLIYIIGAFFIIKGEISVGILIMYAEYFEIMFNAFDTVNIRNAAIKSNTPYYKRIFETIEFPQEDATETKEFVFNEAIDVDFSSFCYPNNEKDVLHSIKLHINKGDYLSIIGESGCGKTTLIKLLLGLYKVSNGAIKYDNTGIENISKEDLYKHIGVVMQDSFLFNMSIRENISISSENITDADLKEACEKADIYDFINMLPNGLDTVIGEQGIKLSGGEKQRLCIARALMKKPELIIFDEATSSLDKHSEDIVYEAINNIAKDTTVIVISHKPSAILRAKTIVVMQDGSITEIGLKNEISKINEFYKAILEGAGMK